MERVKGKVALITGAASGLGKATAILLAGEGATVAVTDIAVNGAQKTAAEILTQSQTASAHALEVTSEQNWETVITEVLEKWGTLDILVNKAALRMFSKTAALECAQAGYNIRVNTIFPGGVMTPMWESMEFWQEPKNKASAEAAWQAMSQDIPLKRFAAPEEIAMMILYLASEESRFVTGADFVIDGGCTAK